MRPGAIPLLILFALSLSAAGDAPPGEARMELELSARDATVGDRLPATLHLRLPAGFDFEPSRIGPQLGSFSVVSGDWTPMPPEDAEADAPRWSWNGFLVCYRTGEFVVPPIRVEYRRADGSSGAAESPAVEVVVHSVLDPEEANADESPDLADLKPPASLEPDYSGLWLLLLLALLTAGVAALAWWLRRRRANLPARADAAQDRFRQVPPHVWVHEALQALLERGLVEQGRLDEFFAELSRIVKLYLEGRYRIDLLEHTTGEVPAVLEQARTPSDAIEGTSDLLGLADRVKFAAERPPSETCGNAVDRVRRIVEATKPREPIAPAEEPGAA